MNKWLTGIVLLVLGFTLGYPGIAVAGGRAGIARPVEPVPLASFAPGLGGEPSRLIASLAGGVVTVAGRVNGQITPASRLSFLAAGPVDLLITDSLGRRVGVDPGTGEVLQEIPNIFYYGPHETFEGTEIEMITVHNPLAGTYAVRLGSTGEGWFDLTVVIGSGLDDEVILHDLSSIFPGQVREYTVEGERRSLPERSIVYALPVLKEAGEWNSTLHLQNPTETASPAMVTLYNSQGQNKYFASNQRVLAPFSTLPITLAGELSLPASFWGMATVEGQGGQLFPLAATVETTDRRRMDTEGIAGSTSTLYVPYLPKDDILSTLYILSASDEGAVVQMNYYAPDGTFVPTAAVTLAVAPRSVLLSTLQSGLPESFSGSAVVESLYGQSLIGSVLLENPSGQAALYSVPITPSSALFIPQLLKGRYGIQTFLQVQNTLSTTTQIVVRYYDQDGQPLSAAETRVDIPGHGAAQIVQQENPFLPAGFRGSALVQSVDGAPLIAVVIGEDGPGQDTLAAGSGFSAGSPLVALPYLSNEDRLLALQVQNLGGSATDVVLNCYDEAGLPVYYTITNLLPNGSASFVTATLPLPSGFNGSAVLESTGGQPLVAFVWQKGITEGLSLYGGSPVGSLLVPPESIASASPEVSRALTISVTFSTNAPPAEVASTTLWVRAPLTTSWASTGLVLTGTGGAFVFTPTQGDGLYRFATVAAGPSGSVEEGPAGEGDAQTRYIWIPLVGPNFAVSTYPTANNQEWAAVAYGGSGAHLVTWQGPGNGVDVFGQVVSSEGMLISATLPLDTRGGDAKYPDVAGNESDGEFLAVWQYDSGGGWIAPNWDIYARRVNAAGMRVGGLITVYSGSDNQEYPAVAFNTSGGEYLVVWRSFNPATGLYGIYGQRLLSTGQPTGSLLTIWTSMAQLASPDVTFNAGDAEYLVTWQEAGIGGGGGSTTWGVRGRILEADGDPATEVFGVATGNKDATLPAASYSAGDGEYLVTWQQYTGGVDYNDVLARRVSISGTLVGVTLTVATGSDDQRVPEVTYSSERGEYLVSWERLPLAGIGGWGVYARRVNAAGGIGTELAVSDGLMDERYPAVSYDRRAGQYVVAWQDYRSGSTGDIYAQRVAEAGSLRGNAVLVNAQPESHAQQQVAAAYGSGQERHLVVWTDNRNGNDDVYGQLVSAGGALVGSAIPIANNGSYPEQEPAVAYDPTHDEYLVVWVRGAPITGQWIRAWRVNAQGVRLGSELDIFQAKAQVGHPAVAYNAALDYYLVVWEDSRDGNWDLWARAVLGGKGDLGREFVVARGENAQLAPSVAADAREAYLVVWQEEGEGVNWIYGQRADAAAVIGEPVIIADEGNRRLPAVAWNEEIREYLVAWEEYTGGDYDVYGQRVGVDGKPVGNGLAIVSRAGDQRDPAVASNGTGGWAAAWQQGSSSTDIHACMLDDTGMPLGEEQTLTSAANNQQGPALSYDEGRHRFLAVWTDYRNSGSSPDVYGQLFEGYTVAIE